MEDEKILDLYFDRDEKAIHETDVKYGAHCRRIAYNILANHEDSEECVNDTYLGAWNAIPPTRPNSFIAFLSRITRNLSLKRLEYRSRDKRADSLLVSFEELETVLSDDRFAPGVSDEDIGRLISRFLESQKEDARIVFVRRYFYFDSIHEIADRYRFSESKVKNLLLRTRNKLRDYLTKEGVAI